VDSVTETKIWTYQYGEYKIELKPTLGNFELYVNGEVQATTKGKIKFRFLENILLFTKNPLT
jgi:hypothetical protein